MQQSKLYEIALGFIPGIGDANLRLLISYCGAAEAVFKAPKAKLEKIPGVGKGLLQAISENRENALKQADTELKKADDAGCRLLFYLDKDFPTRLKQIPDAPTLLYYSGNASLNPKKIISIVGTRHCTQYGRDITEQIIKDLAMQQPTIISGLAYGIDIAAHRAALQAGLPTIGVMASGINIIYPPAHAKTAQQMTTAGGLLTEYSFGTKPDAFNFPARNRIIAGLSDCTLVVEANAKGGALITAEIADSNDRDVLAVPGPINASASAGCNNLIKQHKAGLYSSAKDLIELLNWDQEHAPPKLGANNPDLNGLEPEERAIVEVLQQTEAEQIDAISWKTQIGISRTASLLLQLEFKGFVKSLPGKKFALAGKHK